MGCLDNIVGLSRKDCECFQADRPADWNTSQSGLYLDELPGLTQKNIDTSTDCGEGGIWDIMQRALENGERRFRTDLLSSLFKKFKNRFPPFDGIIGKRDFNGIVPITDNLMGVRIYSNGIKGSSMTLKGIDTFFDQTGNITATIYRSDSNDPFSGPFVLDTLANKKKSNVLPNPVEMPLYVEGLGDFYYHIVYTLPGGMTPLNTQLACKCNRNKKRPWALWVDVEGIKTDAYIDVYTLDNLGGNSFTYGLNLVTQIECKKGNIICEEGHIFDFQNDEIALQIAHAIQEISGVMLINEILSRPDSAYFALNEEQLSQLGAQYASSYQDRIQYIALNIEPSNDCFICNNQMQGTAILS